MKKKYVISSETDKIYNKVYKLTDEGLKIAEDINKHVVEICTYVSGDISNEEMESFYRTLEKLSNRIVDSESVFFSRK